MIQREKLNSIDTVYTFFDNDRVLGFVEIRNVDNVIDIMNVYVYEESRRKGIATALLNEIINKEKYSRIMLEVNEKNLPAIKLYNKLNFKEISLRERYYGQDTAIIMEKVKK